MRIPRIVIAGVSSGVGKTLVACAVTHGIRKRGYTVQPFKVGPDYIDPGYLSLAAGRDARNLDTWIMGRSRMVESFAQSSTSDVSVIEGVMGHYDGLSGRSNRASTFEAAQILDAPVILVVDASRAARSIAATVKGFATYQKPSNIIGVVLNRVGSRRHVDFCADSLEQAGMAVLGSIPRDESYALESRHLGLIPPIEGSARAKKAIAAFNGVEECIDVDTIINTADSARSLKIARPEPRPKKPKRATIAVALDSSFNFYYRDNLDALEREGARLKFFSPVADKRLPECDGLYIGGGFPEVLGSSLENNSSMRRAIRAHAIDERRTIYAECGGLMYLTRGITSGKRRYVMSGVIDAQTKMAKKPVLGYTRGMITRKCIISPRPLNMRGHEFHYSTISDVPRDTAFAYSLEVGTGIAGGRDGIMQDAVLASYGHLYFGDTLAGNRAGSIVEATRAAARR